MRSTQPAQSIRYHQAGIAATLGDRSWPTKIECTRNVELRQTNSLVSTVHDLKVWRIQSCPCAANKRKAVEAEASFIHRGIIDDVRQIERKDLFEVSANVAEPGKVIAQQRRLVAVVTLQCVITVQTICPGEVMTDVQRPLVHFNVSGCRADKTWGA